MLKPQMLAVNALFVALLLPQMAFAICGDGIREATEECDGKWGWVFIDLSSGRWVHL